MKATCCAPVHIGAVSGPAAREPFVAAMVAAHHGRPGRADRAALGCVAAARDLAALQGCESATLGTSTLHLFWDLGEIFAASALGDLYRRRRLSGGDVGDGASGSTRDARAALCASRCGRAVVVCCGGVARQVEARGGERWLLPRLWEAGAAGSLSGDGSTSGKGWLVIDDTQALGILGHSPGREPAVR